MQGPNEGKGRIKSPRHTTDQCIWKETPRTRALHKDWLNSISGKEIIACTSL